MTMPDDPTLPVIVLVSGTFGDELVADFGRYAREYDVVCASSAIDAIVLLARLRGESRPVALIVSDSELPDMPLLEALQTFRTTVPTARRVVVIHWSRFGETVEALRVPLQKGKFDAFLLMPRGVRDEEFHYAITELLSDWGATVGLPVVESVRIIAAELTPLTMAVRDFLDRMGMPHRTYPPDSPQGIEAAELIDGEVSYPIVHSLQKNRTGADCPRHRGHDLWPPVGCRRRLRRRPRGHRRGPGGTRGRRLRHLRGPVHGGAGVGSGWGTSGYKLYDPELLGLPAWHLRNAPRPASAHPGGTLRCGLLPAGR